jgi:CDP-diacylglycerol--serine O-phosphatidyltransferase
VKIKENIPNLLTVLNLFCGCFAIMFAVRGQFMQVAFLFSASLIFDFFDGFIARILHAKSSIGKELDSLADMVSFGVLPGVIFFMFISISLNDMFKPIEKRSFINLAIESAGFLITIFSALRLAKFNIDTRQEDSFIGVPTPANAIFVLSLPLALMYDIKINPFVDLKTISLQDLTNLLFITPFQTIITEVFGNIYFLLAMVAVSSYLLVSNITLFSLKFKTLKWTDNAARYVFILGSILIYLLFAIIPRL